MNSSIPQHSGRRLRLLAYGVGVCVLLSVAGFLLVFWWTAPIYLDDVVELTDVRIDGQPISSQPIDLVALSTHQFTCTAICKRGKFAIIDSGQKPYLDNMPFIPDSIHEVPQGSFDPTFYLAFGSDIRWGRPVGNLVAPRVKTNPSGESAFLTQSILVPSHPGSYHLHLLWVNNPDGWVQVRPRVWTQKKPKNDAVVWKASVNVTSSPK